MRRPGLAAIWIAASCVASEPEPPLVPSAPPPQVKVVEPADPGDGSGSALHVGAGAAVPVQLRFTTVGRLHQGYFGRPELVRELGKGLGACTTHTVDVDVVWSQADLEGRIIGVLPQASSGCRPALSGDVIDLTPVVPASRAVARFRDAVAGTSDFRIANFVAGVDLVRGGTTCRLRAAGQHPPDGTRFHPCVLVNGAPVCAQGSPETGVDRLAFAKAADRAKVVKCLER